MEEIFKQYGPAIIIAVLVVAIIAIVVFLAGDGGPLEGIFEGLITDFGDRATQDLNGTP